MVSSTNRRPRDRSLKRTGGALLAAVLAVATGACGTGDQGGEREGDGESAAPAVEVTRIEGVGFQGPESALYDESADAYLVSNINGEPTAEDGDGFISRVSPDGSVSELRWIDGAAEGVTLNAPKGMAIVGDSLYVADIDCVRVFNRSSGEPVEAFCIDGATFLNDITADENQTLYVTDTGNEEDAPGAVHRLRRNGARAELASGPQLGGPNGITISPRGILVVSTGTGEIYRLSADGQKTPVAPASERRLDGIVFLPDERFYFSSWGDSAVYEVATDGSVSRVVEGVAGPADMGFDSQRNRLLIPLLPGNALLLRPVGTASPGGGAEGSAGS